MYKAKGDNGVDYAAISKKVGFNIQPPPEFFINFRKALAKGIAQSIVADAIRELHDEKQSVEGGVQEVVSG